MLVALVLVVEVLILQAYANVNRSTVIFSTGIGRGREDTALAHAIIKLSHTLQLDAVAEGIEEAEQAASLVTPGCRDGQGYHFARPLTAAAMTELLGKTLADGGFYLPGRGRPVESLTR